MFEFISRCGKFLYNDYQYPINNKRKYDWRLMTDKLTELILHLIIQANTAKEVVELYVQYNYPVHLCKEENAIVKPNQKFSY